MGPVRLPTGPKEAAGVEERQMVVRDEAPADQPRSADPAAGNGRRTSLLSLAVFDVGGPLVIYYSMRAAGISTVVSLVVSGVPPAIGIGLNARRHRRLDAIGVVVLLGIVTGAILGLATGSARLVLIDGTVPTGVLGIACFASFLTARPLMYRVALQFMGAESAQGREFVSLWQFQPFRRMFTVITVVWGAVFLGETAAQIAIIEFASANTAKTSSNVMPVVVAALAVAWTFAYGRRLRKRGERAAAAERSARAGTEEAPGPAGPGSSANATTP
jgi:hypothetical protein